MKKIFFVMALVTITAAMAFSQPAAIEPIYPGEDRDFIIRFVADSAGLREQDVGTRQMLDNQDVFNKVIHLLRLDDGDVTKTMEDGRVPGAFTRLLVDGHAHPVGDENTQSNSLIDLSNRRARAVLDFLVGHFGADNERIITAAAGGSYPWYTGGGDPGRVTAAGLPFRWGIVDGGTTTTGTRVNNIIRGRDEGPGAKNRRVCIYFIPPPNPRANEEKIVVFTGKSGNLKEALEADKVGKNRVDSNHSAMLAVFRTLMESDKYRLYIDGHANRGEAANAAAALTLSRQRAKQVEDYFFEYYGVPRDRLISSGAGDRFFVNGGDRYADPNGGPDVDKAPSTTAKALYNVNSHVSFYIIVPDDEDSAPQVPCNSCGSTPCDGSTAGCI